MQRASPIAKTSVGVSSTPLVERLLTPFVQFAHTASAGGIVLLATTAIAMAWANSPWAHGYHALWELHVGLRVATWSADLSLHELVNDGLMAVFFFLVGLEIKREVIAGELATVRSAALPMIAALGGMIVPALLYTAAAHAGPASHGWGVPMATDIAFALGVLALLGDRVPTSLKVFLAALAIVDDIGAVLVIAIFYSTGVAWGALGAALALVALSLAMGRAGVRRPWAYAVLGVALWAAMLASGIHATVAGVLLALTIPVRTRIDERAFVIHARAALDRFRKAALVTAHDPNTTALSNAEHHAAIEDLETLSEQAQPPLIRMETGLHGIVAFAIMPLFALANAGVTLNGAALAAAASSTATLGILLGLALGKPLGIAGFSWLAVRLGLASLPSGVRWGALVATSVLGGIGFTMALFIGGLAFADPAQLDAAKMGVLAASTVTGLVGYGLLRRTLARGA